MEKAVTGNITPEWVFSNLSRSFRHSLLNIDLRQDAAQVAPNGWFIDQDFIPRRSTSASVLIQGVLKGENPELTVMWTVLGYPPVAVSLPLFVKGELPQGVVKNEAGHSHYCDWALAAKKDVFPITRGNGKRYFRFDLLYNEEQTGWIQAVELLEKHMHHVFLPYMKNFREQGGLVSEDLKKYYEEVHPFIVDLYGTTTLH